MRKTFTIGEIAKILNVPVSTLRFWEKQGLFHISKCENNYRNYTTTDIIQIADIMFYRNLGIPIRDVNDFITVPFENYEESLEDVQVQIKEKIQRYEKMQNKIQLQLERYQILQTLLKCPFQEEEPPFSTVISWNFWEKENITYYIEDPARYVWYKDTSKDTPGKKGLIQYESFKNPNAPVVFQKREQMHFVTFPIRARVAENYEGVEAEEIVEKYKKKYQTGILLAQHLLTCEENGCHVEYLKGYLELREPI